MKKLILLIATGLIVLNSCEKEESHLEYIRLNEENVSVGTGNQHLFILECYPSGISKPKGDWSTSNPKVVEIEEVDINRGSCKIRGLLPGNAIVTFQESETGIGLIAKSKVTVYSNARFAMDTVQLKVGETKDMNIYVQAYEGYTQWWSSDKEICTIGDDGILKAISDGECTIFAKLVKYDTIISCAVKVKPVVRIETDSLMISLKGESRKAKYTITPEKFASSVNITSSDESIVKIINNEYISAINVGTAFVTFSTIDGVSSQMRIEVLDNIIDAVKATVSIPGSVSINGYVTGTVEATIYYPCGTDIRITKYAIYANNGNTVLVADSIDEATGSGFFILLGDMWGKYEKSFSAPCNNAYLPSCFFEYQYDQKRYSITAQYDPLKGLF